MTVLEGVKAEFVSVMSGIDSSLELYVPEQKTGDVYVNNGGFQQIVSGSSGDARISIEVKSLPEPEKWQDDVTNIMRALLDRIEEVDHKVIAAFSEISKIDTRNLRNEEILESLESIWVDHLGEGFRTKLQKLIDLDFLKGALASTASTLMLSPFTPP